MRSLPLNELWHDVRQFHITFGHPWRSRPALQPADRVDMRASWIDEEVRELLAATTIEDQVDAYIDVIYFAIGGLVEIGVAPGEIWNLVHGANMAKVWPDGTVHRREDTKVIKPDGWVAPDAAIAEEIERQQREKD